MSTPCFSRNLRAKHLAVLADEAMRRISFVEGDYACPGWDPRRPFGSCNVAGDILDILSIEWHEGDRHYDELRDYAWDLWAEVPRYLKARWFEMQRSSVHD